MSIQRRAFATLVCIVLAGLFIPVRAAVPVDVVKTDLRPLIRAAASSRVQFAVHVPYSASPKTAGSWSMAGAVATWRYAVSVPTAVSLSFHAIPARLPDGATLLVRSATTTVVYHPGDVRHNDLWSRIHPGDTLQFELTVPAAERDQVALQITSLQAGYRGLGGGVADHPYYRQLRQEQASTGNASCVQNYACSVTTANTPLGQATVALVIANAYQCTGTLINDVPNDNTPYVLTARHCETGVLGGGDPGQAAEVTVYWDAVTPCGQTLGTLYDPGIRTQSGATTMVEQQDAWLIQLNDNPIVSDAQFAGFDATGGTILGGYTVQHALGYDKQFTSWFGQALGVRESAVLGVQYESDFWEVVNQLGNIGPGASGSGLVDQNNHLVGSLTLGRTTSDPSGYASCPISPPTAPNGTNGAADFTSLAAVWSSTADTTSSTGSATIKSILDPQNSGTRVVPSMPVAPITFTTSSASPQDGQSIELTWSAPNAVQCVASNGVAGDGWSGNLPASGSRSVSETAGITVKYKVTCNLTTGGNVTATVSVFWYGSVPFVQVYIDRTSVWTTRPATITWTSNVSPCQVSGGTLSLSNQPSTGSATTTQSSTGDVTYTVSCGSGPTAASGSSTVTYITPSLALEANATDRILGEDLTLQWATWADTCVPTGGAPNDGWGTTIFGPLTGYFSPRPSTVGTYTYTLTCSSGPISVTQSVTVTIENNAPYVTASVTPTSVTYSASPADYITLNWTTNLSQCNINSTPVLGGGVIAPTPTPPFPIQSGFLVDGPVIIAPQAPGTYTLSVTCDAVGEPMVTSTPMTVTVGHPPAPTATISASPASIVEGSEFTVTWSSTNASNCEPAGNLQASGAVWGGGPLGASGSLVLQPNEPGQYTIGISCNSIDSSQGSATAQTTVSITAPPPLAAQMTASSTQLIPGQSFTITWSSSAATACTASGGGANGSTWSGNLSTSGSVTQTATTIGTYTYTVTCSSGSQSASSQVAVEVNPSSSGGASTVGKSGGGGGGGTESLLDLALLAAVWSLRRIHRPSLQGR